MVEADNFDYNKAVKEAEIMLEVIEKEPPNPPGSLAEWAEPIKDLIPVFYSLAISGTALNISIKALEDSKSKDTVFEPPKKDPSINPPKA